MILVDANLLLYAHDSRSTHHARALAWWKHTLSHAPVIGIPLHTLSAFIRIATHRAVFERPLTPEEACRVVSQWFDVEAVQLVSPGPNYWHYLSEVVKNGQITGALVSDACIAALALQYDATVVTNDLDFRRFDVRVDFPLRTDQ